jgi:hypothetical protein
MRGVDELLEVLERAIGGIEGVVVGNVVPVVVLGRRKGWQQPDRCDAEILDVVELLDQAAEVTDAVGVVVVEGFDVQLVQNRVLVPERIGRAGKAAPDRAGGTGETW